MSGDHTHNKLKSRTMSKDNVYYGLFLSDRQLDFLYKYPQGFDRMKCFATFLQMAVTKPTHYEKKEYSVDLTPGQFAISEVELAKLWKCNRKTASKMVDMFHEVRLVSSVPNCRTTIFTVHCIASWYIDDEVIRNQHYSRHPQIEQRIKANHKTAPDWCRNKTATGNESRTLNEGMTTKDATCAKADILIDGSVTPDNNSLSLSSKEIDTGITAHQSDGQTIEQRDENTSKQSFPASHNNSNDCNGREKELSNDGVEKPTSCTEHSSLSAASLGVGSTANNPDIEAQPPSMQPDKVQTDATATATAEPKPGDVV